MNRMTATGLFVAALITMPAAARAQTAEGTRDALFPGKGKTSFTASSGIPYVGIAEYGYSVSDRFTAGLVGGFTPTTKGIGVRVRGVVAQPSDNFRLYLKAPILYYPPSDDSHYESWLLAWPTLNAEWRVEGHVRIWTGAGLIGAGCAHSLLGIEDEAMEKGGPGFHGGVWNTFQIGASKSVSDKTTVHAEVSSVMKGLKTSNDRRLGGKTTDLYWDGGFPIIIEIGISRVF